MDVVALFHERLAYTVMLFFLFAGLWGIAEYVRGGSLGGNIAGALIVGQGLVIVQGLLGLVLYIANENRAHLIHWLYGITAVIVMPAMWSYTKDRNPRGALLLYSLIALFIFGLSIRGMLTASS